MSELTTLAALAEVNPKTPIPLGQTVSFVGMEDISEAFHLVATHDRSSSDLGAGYTRFRDGDLLFAKITPCMENGKGATVNGLTNGLGMGSTEFHVLRPRALESKSFIAQWLASPTLRRAAERNMTGSAGQRRVPSAFFARFRIPRLTIREQQAVGSTLDDFDAQVESTKRIIDKYRLQRTGLIDRVVVDATNRVGQNTSLGEVIRRHGGLIQTGPFGSQLHASDYVGVGVPVVMPQDITEGRVDLDAIARVPDSMAKSLRRHRMRPGDVVFARRGDLERCAEITSREQDWLCGTGCLLVRTPPAVLSAGWLALVYGHELGQRHVRAHAVGSTMANLNRGILGALKLPVPPIEEQRHVANLLDALDLRIASERKILAKLIAKKEGLLVDLLPGRVRVPIEVAS